MASNPVIPDSVIKSAQAAQRATGCPASVTIAQWIDESSYGKRTPPGSNNPFGIKAAAGQDYVLATTDEVVNGRTVVITAKFRRFATLDEAFILHGQLLMSKTGPYRHCRPGPGFVECIAPIYATNPHYASQLQVLIKQYGLLRYDVR